MNILLRLLAPALLLGALLLIGERPTNPPDEITAVELSAASEEQDLRSAPCPGFIADGCVVALLPVRLPAAAAACLKADAPPPEPRSHSPPLAA
ncbi:MAG: hypothetical protein HYV14_06015 [Elusimicrobia bacterium]|nr:hypothetical protein [Elusimicrobiota bacterium]